MSFSAKRTRTDAESSSGIGRASPSTATFAISGNQRAEVLLTDEIGLTGGGGKPGQRYPAILTCSAAASPAKTSASPGTGADSRENDQACSSSSPGSRASLFAPEGGSSLRTYPDYFPPTEAATSPSYSRRWPTSGSWTGPGECWTHDTSECPSDGGAYSSLRDVLQEAAPARFSLSPKAAAGILRRAEKRDRALPEVLQTALRALAASWRAEETTVRRRTS